MFPLNVDQPVIKKDGSRTTLGDITGDFSGIEDDLESLDSRLDTAEGDIDEVETDISNIKTSLQDKYVVVGTRSIILAVQPENGTKTVGDLLTEAITNAKTSNYCGLNNLDPSDYGADAMTLNSISVPAFSSSTDRIIYLRPYTTYANSISTQFAITGSFGIGKVENNSNSESRIVAGYMGLTSGSSRLSATVLKTSGITFTDYVNIVPGAGATLVAYLTFYKKL